MTLRSAARTMPSLARMPMAVPAWDMASSAYSTWYKRPSGEKMVVCACGKHHGRQDTMPRGFDGPSGAKGSDRLTRESYLLDMMAGLR